MKRMAALLIFMFLLPGLKGKDLIELVESIPLETTLDNADIRNTQDVWLGMIRSAKKTLDFGEFYISHQEGESLTPVLDAVVLAADRGVKVRFIVDGNMYKTYPGTADKLNEHRNIDVRIYDLSQITGGVLHAKYFIVDDKEIFLGSQNFDWRALDHIHELGIRIRNRELTGFYRELFELDWALAAKGADTEGLLKDIAAAKDLQDFRVNSHEYGDVRLIPTASNPKIIYHVPNWDETQLINMIAAAEHTVKIQLLSYKPLSGKELYSALDLELRKAAARGVKIDMILSDWNYASPGIDYIKSLHAIPNIEIRFSTIPDYSGGYIGYARVEHCKYMVVDSKTTWIGTSNWSKSYFHNGRNLGIILENGPLSERVSQLFMKSWESGYCRPVEADKAYQTKVIEE